MIKYLVSVLLLATSMSVAQTRTLDREYVPVIIKGETLPLDDMMIDNWTFFRYSMASAEWTRIPVQIDEVMIIDGQRKYNKAEAINGTIDTWDEIVVMPGDLGDRAPTSEWLSDPALHSGTRLELEFQDPQDPDETGWLYAYRLPQKPSPSLFTYQEAPSPGSAADTLSTPAYTIAHTSSGWLNYLSLSGEPTDFVDRLKLRLSGLFYGQPYQVTEEHLSATDDPVSPHLYTLRSFRDVRNRVALPIVNLTTGADYSVTYYPYAIHVGVIDADISATTIALLGLRHVRQSIDFSPSTAGAMTFYSAANPDGIPIDGNPDTPANTLPTDTGLHWTLASGNAGTVILAMDVPAIENAQTRLYYWDQQQPGTTGDQTLDTGDLRSFGDMGIQLDASTALKTNRLNIGLWIYAIDKPNQTADFGQTLVDWIAHPPTIISREQQQTTTAVDNQPRHTPETFQLSATYPNPIPSGQTVQANLTAPPGSYTVEIINILGQRILSRPLSIPPGTSTAPFRWQGLDRLGQRVPPGLYVLVVRTPRTRLHQKVVVTRP
jgi:hypothetical protein